MLRSEEDFFMRALKVPSAAAPTYALCAYLLKKCEESDSCLSCLGSASVQVLSLLLSPIDTAIQLVVTPIWIILDELFSNQTPCDRACAILFVIPLKLVYGAITTPIVAIGHIFFRVLEAHSANGAELSYDVNNRMAWVIHSLRSEKPVDKTGMNVVFPDTVEKNPTLQSSINRLVLPKLREAGYDHLYVIDAVNIPLHSDTYGNASLTDKHFILMVDLNHSDDGTEDMSTQSFSQLSSLQGWDSAMPAGTLGKFELVTKRDLWCSFDFLPFRVAQKLDALVAKPPFAATGTDS